MKIISILSVVFLLAVYGTAIVAGGNTLDAPAIEPMVPICGMPNPSAVWADQRGYQYEIRTDASGGEYGICILPDGTVCDAWDLYRQSLPPEPETLIGMPNPSAIWADQMGYQYVIRKDADGNENGVCILPDGTERDAWKLFCSSSISDLHPYYGDPGTLKPEFSLSRSTGFGSLASIRLSALRT